MRTKTARETECLPLSPASAWVELRVNDRDWEEADPALLGTLLCHLHLIRGFEECVLELATEGLVHGPVHSSIGQEGAAAGSIVGLTAADQINGSHRGHHQFLSKALGYVHRWFRTRAFLSGLNFRTCCSGRWPNPRISSGLLQRTRRLHAPAMVRAGALGTNAIVGGGVPLAAGAAWAHKHASSDAVMVTYFGDGAANIGSVLETMNLASVWEIPAFVFFIENNRYAVSTRVEESTAETRLSAQVLAFGIRSWKVDGMNPLAVYLAMQQALAHLRAGNGPAIVEADCYRFLHQSGSPCRAAPSVIGRKKKSSSGRRGTLDLVQPECKSADSLTMLRSRRCAGVCRKPCSAWQPNSPSTTHPATPGNGVSVQSCGQVRIFVTLVSAAI